MYKYSLLLLASISVLSADLTDFTLYKQAGMNAKYFIKLGSYSNAQNAQKILQHSRYAKRILFLQKYYSVVGKEYSSLKDAQENLQEIKKLYKDAYIIELYKNPQSQDNDKISLSEFQKAINQYHNKEYEEALVGFDRVLIDDENNLDAKIYYAMTLYKLGIYDEAKKTVQEILKRDLSKDQKRKIDTLLKAIETKTKRHFFTTIFSIGAGYDDNINLNTDELYTQYAGRTLQNDTKKSKSSYGLASLLISHRYHGNSIDVVTSLYSYNEFAHTHNENNMNFLNLSTSVIKSINDWTFSLPMGVNGAYLDGKAVAYNLYTNPTISYRISNNLKTHLETSYLNNDTKFMSGRDYTLKGVHIGLTYKNRRLKTGLQVGFDDVDQKRDLRFDVEKDVVSASVFEKYFIFSSTFIAANVGYLQESYKKLDQNMGYRRSDDILNAGLSLGQQIGQNSLMELGYAHKKNDSNVNAYSYDKNIYTIEYKYRF